MANITSFLTASTTASDNEQVNGIGINGTNPVSNFDNAMRENWAILRRDLDGRTVLASKSANYTALANDNNAVIRFSAAATLSLTDAATLGAGWHCWVMADGSAVIVDPDSAETINGATTITIPDGYSTLVICDGTNFRAFEDYATNAAALATKADIASVTAAAPPGSVSAFAMNSAPTGWLKANGAAISRTTYADLFTAIGTTFGTGDGSTTFNLPDLRGEFVRGWDDSRGVDSGRVFGSSQLDQLQGFKVQMERGGSASGVGASTGSAPTGVFNTSTSPITDGVNGTPRTGTETRSRNIALLLCIKF